jgi:hypothetical protein
VKARDPRKLLKRHPVPAGERPAATVTATGSPTATGIAAGRTATTPTGTTAVGVAQRGGLT